MGNYFSTNLKYIREQKGLSQNKLANMIGVNQTTIARWEDDNRIPTIDNAVDISEKLNIPLPELLGKDLRLKQKDNNNSELFATTIYKDDISSIEIKSDKPLSSLSGEEQQMIIQRAMDELYEFKRELKNKEKKIDKQLGED